MSHRVVYEESSTNGLGPTGWKDEAIFFCRGYLDLPTWWCTPDGVAYLTDAPHGDNNVR